MLALVPADTQAEHESPATQLVHRRGRPGQQRRMPKSYWTNQRTEAQALSFGGGQRESGPSFERMSLAVHQRHEMVRSPERFVPQLLGRGHDLAPAFPGEPLLAFDHDSELQRPPPGTQLPVLTSPWTGSGRAVRLLEPGGESVTPGGAIIWRAEIEGERPTVTALRQAAEDASKID